MPLNADKPNLWKADIERSIDYYNDWFLRFAPQTYREQRILRTNEAAQAFKQTDNLRLLTPKLLRKQPGLLPILRMTSAPPLARDRLMGLAYANKNLIGSMEGKADVPPRIPSRMSATELDAQLQRICDVLAELLDHDLFPWIVSQSKPGEIDLSRAAAVVADRLCGAASDPIIRNAQERRQLAAIEQWLDGRGYLKARAGGIADMRSMDAGTYAFRHNIPAGSPSASVNIPIDCIIQPFGARKEDIPILIEAKSAGDATNTNKRRKEEAQKAAQLRARYGNATQLILFLCGYFETGYLGYEAAEGLDWVWEHRMDDLGKLVPAHRTKKKR
jgi:hypothetical protein